MKDYSLSENERKDFILDFDITDDGRIIVHFADGKSLALLYNQRNEQILISRMEEQFKKASEDGPKFVMKKEKNIKLFCIMLFNVIASGLVIFVNEIVFVDTIFALILSFSSIYGVSFIGQVIHIDNLLEDLNKNRKFLQYKDKINNNIRSNNNVLINVSKSTKTAIEKFPDNRTMFNINSFNYVPFRDIEQIIENVERNERFGFDYTQQEEPAKGLTRKKVR